MVQKLAACTASSLLLFSLATFADGILPSELPRSGVFAGLGGSYNTVYLNQKITGNLTSIYSADGIPAGTLQGNLPYFTSFSPEGTFALQGQAGYFKYFRDSDWLWGGKLLYQYLGFNSSNTFDLFNFVGAIATPPVTTQITQRTSMKINHELALIPFIGHSFNNTQLYLGLGPSVIEAKPKFSQITNFSNIGFTLGQTSSFLVDSVSDTHWMFGGAAQVGFSHYFSPTWFVDLNYTFGFTGTYNYNRNFPIANSSNYPGTGTLLSINTFYSTHTSQYIVVQSLSFTLNKLFML